MYFKTCTETFYEVRNSKKKTKTHKRPKNQPFERPEQMIVPEMYVAG